MLKQTYNVNKKLLTYALKCILILSIAIKAKTLNLNACSGVKPGEVDWVANHPFPPFGQQTCLLQKFYLHFIFMLCVTRFQGSGANFLLHCISWRGENLRC